MIVVTVVCIQSGTIFVVDERHKNVFALLFLSLARRIRHIRKFVMHTNTTQLCYSNISVDSLLRITNSLKLNKYHWARVMNTHTHTDKRRAYIKRNGTQHEAHIDILRPIRVQSRWRNKFANFSCLATGHRNNGNASAFTEQHTGKIARENSTKYSLRCVVSHGLLGIHAIHEGKKSSTSFFFTIFQRIRSTKMWARTPNKIDRVTKSSSEAFIISSLLISHFLWTNQIGVCLNCRQRKSSPPKKIIETFSTQIKCPH